jgi:hypothetical protein
VTNWQNHDDGVEDDPPRRKPNAASCPASALASSRQTRSSRRVDTRHRRLDFTDCSVKAIAARRKPASGWSPAHQAGVAPIGDPYV